MSVHWQQLDSGRAKIFQITNRLLIRDSRIGAAQIFRDLLPEFCESLHVQLIDHCFRKRRGWAFVVAPIESAIDHHRLHHRPRVVTRIARKIFRRIPDGVAEHFIRPFDLPWDRFRVRIEQQLRVVEPQSAIRFNDSKLLLDPNAKAIPGQIKWSDEMFSYTVGDPAEDLSRDSRDNAWAMVKSMVIDSAFNWGDDKRPATALSETVIYELHVKGFTKLWQEIPENLRGTYAGMANEKTIRYLKNLGATAVELLPVHAHLDDKALVDRSLTNYWGYNTIGFFAPHGPYSSNREPGAEVTEFKGMVRNLHAAGIEVILDVVYNHTGEGNHLGPTVCFRGLDNSVYYRLLADDPRFYLDYTGTGNTVDTLRPRTLQLVMDSLRYWATEMRVDGFRFDLAPALARDGSGVNKFHAFFKCVQQDPVLSQVKLIAEPWDVGDGGYQVGNFPAPWSEWNGKYRDTVRSFWKGDEGRIGEVAYRLTGSPDLYEHHGRRPYASVNFVTAHDGFTLNDLVSYNDKHNQANADGNRDGD